MKLEFEYPILKTSLRSGLEGWQYYKCAFEGKVDELDRFRKYIHFDFIYSSACPCSSELSEHARGSRNVYGIPHSQRSTARISVEVADGAHLSLEEIQQIALAALRTETQVMVKREDEQAFAELNGAFTKFVEDAARLLYEQLDQSPVSLISKLRAHLESLHSHDAVAVINRSAVVLPASLMTSRTDSLIIFLLLSSAHWMPRTRLNVLNSCQLQRMERKLPPMHNDAHPAPRSDGPVFCQ